LDELQLSEKKRGSSRPRAVTPALEPWREARRRPRISLLSYLQAAFVWMLYGASRGFLLALRNVLWPRRRPSNPRRICIYRKGFIGDTVVALPAIHLIKATYPQADLTLLTSPVHGKFPGANELLATSGLFNRVHVYLKSDVSGLAKRLSFLNSMRREHFDIWIELPQELDGPLRHLRNMLFARFAAAKWGYGWGFVTTLHLWASAQSKFMTFQNEVDKLYEIVRRAGIATSNEIAFPIRCGSVEQALIDRLLGTNSHPIAALAPGAKRPLSIWPIERFVEVGRHLASKGFVIVILGGVADVATCRAVADGMGDGLAINLAGKTSLIESCEALRRCALLVCNDSGVQHLAAAVGTPCVSIFSAHDMPGKWNPYGQQHVVLRETVECHPCYLTVCPYDNKCLKLIDASRVIAAVDMTLARSVEKKAGGSDRLTISEPQERRRIA